MTKQLAIKNKLIGHTVSEICKQKTREFNFKTKRGISNPMFGRTGEKSPRSKLTDLQKEEIKTLMSTTSMTDREIGLLFFVSRTTIFFLRRKFLPL